MQNRETLLNMTKGSGSYFVCMTEKDQPDKKNQSLTNNTLENENCYFLITKKPQENLLKTHILMNYLLFQDFLEVQF